MIEIMISGFYLMLLSLGCVTIIPLLLIGLVVSTEVKKWKHVFVILLSLWLTITAIAYILQTL